MESSQKEAKQGRALVRRDTDDFAVEHSLKTKASVEFMFQDTVEILLWFHNTDNCPEQLLNWSTSAFSDG